MIYSYEPEYYPLVFFYQDEAISKRVIEVATNYLKSTGDDDLNKYHAELTSIGVIIRGKDDLKISPQDFLGNDRMPATAVNSQEIEDRLYSITKVIIDHVLNIGDGKYAVIHRPKSSNGRAWTYSIVDLHSVNSVDSYCQFEEYVDMIINLGIHAKIGMEDDRVFEAVNLIILGAKQLEKKC